MDEAPILFVEGKWFGHCVHDVAPTSIIWSTPHSEVVGAVVNEGSSVKTSIGELFVGHENRSKVFLAEA
jgi:hypothetical protein